MARHKRKGGRRKGSGVAGILVAFSLVAALAAVGAWWLVTTPFGPTTETFVNVAPGSSAATIARKLEAAGVVRTRYAFDLVRFIYHGRLQAGTYRFDRPLPPAEIYLRITRGDVYTKILTVPEGANIFDIAARVQQAGLGTRQDFLIAAATQASLIADIDPHATSLEGYLFPDTYRFPPTVNEEQIVAAMVRRFRQEAQKIGLLGNSDMHRIVTMASIVEKETADPNERPVVASVYYNRLNRNMALAADPSVIYAALLAGRYRGTIYESDLQFDSPYNTYKHAGLPPGPIANPGIASLEAAMHPAQTEFLYFVSDNNGHHRFARDSGEHARNVAAYRKAQATNP